MAVFSSGCHSDAPEDRVSTEAQAQADSSAPLAIEGPPGADGPIKLDVGTGAPVSLFDRLGPTIVSKDGTLSRIGNWQEMDDLERARVLRVLGKRNEIRLTGLRDAQAEAGAEGAKEAEEPK